MQRPSVRRIAALFGAVLLASCSDNPVASRRPLDIQPGPAILDAPRGGHPEFFWLPPTVAVAPNPTGVFDAGALVQLAVEVCELDTTGNSCTAAEPERHTRTSLPAASRIRLNSAGKFYEMLWQSKVNAVDKYRVSVLRGTAQLGYVDVQMVNTSAELALVDPVNFTGLVRGQQLTVRFRIERPVARNYVRINEVESNQGVPGDWVELHNSGRVAFELDGYVFRDDNNTRGYTLPAGTTIQPNGYLVIDEAQFGFGLGAADMARLFLPDGTTLVDGYTWAAHATTTYGRCPDGSGAFVNTAS